MKKRLIRRQSIITLDEPNERQFFFPAQVCSPALRTGILADQSSKSNTALSHFQF